jgi:hypothetical protein
MTIFIRTIVFCLFSAVLWGCTGAPRFGDRPAAIQPPKSWTMPPGVASEWTAQSLDARLDPEVQRLIQQTLRANLDLRLALVRMEIAQNSLAAANGRRLPAAEFSLRAGRERQVVDKDTYLAFNVVWTQALPVPNRSGGIFLLELCMKLYPSVLHVPMTRNCKQPRAATFGDRVR